MKTRKNSLLRWVAMIELVLGAYDLMTGLMSAFVLITDLEGVTASFTESGVEFSVPILVIFGRSHGHDFCIYSRKAETSSLLRLRSLCFCNLVSGYTDRIYGSWSSFVHASLLSSPWTLYVGSCKE